MKKSIQTVGIIGGGPSGATLASLLAMKGIEVTIFDDERRPDLIVGESLIPAIVPVLRKLGIEERCRGEDPRMLPACHAVASVPAALESS